MQKKMFVNLCVKNLSRSVEFFTSLGFSFNPKFTDETATCLIISQTSFVMLLTEAKFKEFTKKPIVDAKKTTEVLVCLTLDHKDKVNEMLEQALANGATEAREPQDYGFMYGRSFEDLDGHIWEIMWMDSEFAS